MNPRLRKYERYANYWLGIGLGWFTGGFAFISYTRHAWWYVAAGVAAMIVGGIFGTLARREQLKDKK